jgi:hypothetical protein
VKRLAGVGHQLAMMLVGAAALVLWISLAFATAQKPPTIGR